MNRSKGSSSRRTFLRLAALLLPAGALLGSLPGVRAAARPRKLYLAGPDVFRADAVAHGEALKALCARYGFEGLYPLDNALPKQLAEPREQAAWIYRANIGLIERADAVLANLNFFRGAEPDSGTAFEVGYATALGKPVYGYVDDAGSYAERIRRHAPELIGEDPTRDRDGMTLEEFGLPLNLMLAVPATLVVGDASRPCANSPAGATADPAPAVRRETQGRRAIRSVSRSKNPWASPSLIHSTLAGCLRPPYQSATVWPKVMPSRLSTCTLIRLPLNSEGLSR